MTDTELVGILRISDRPEILVAAQRIEALTAECERLWALYQQTATERSDRQVECERLQFMIQMITDQLDASEPRAVSGQSCGPRAEDWVMTPSTRRALRWVLKWTPVKKETP